MTDTDVLTVTDGSREVDGLTDDDVVVTMMSEQILSPKRMRIKLLDFLLHSPPPEPLHWVSFRDYIVERFKSYYSQKIIKDVFHLIDRTITKTRRVSAVIDLDSEDDTSAPSCEKGASNQGESQLVPDSLNCNNSCDEVVEEIFLNSPADSLCSKEDIENFKRDPVVRTYSRLFKDIYKLLKDIQESTSCRICSKLRYRLTRFQQAVSNESRLLKKAAESEQVPNQTIPRLRRPSTDSKMVSLFRKLSSEFLTQREAEKIREAILTDKLLELSYVDVLSSAELNRPGSDDVALPESESPNSRQIPERKSKKRRHPRPDADTEGAADAENDSNFEPASACTKGSKRRRKTNLTTATITPDSTEAADMEDNANSKPVPAQNKNPSRHWKKKLNSATVTPDSSEAADMEDNANSKPAPAQNKSPSRHWKKKLNSATVTPDSSENALGVDGVAPDELLETPDATAPTAKKRNGSIKALLLQEQLRFSGVDCQIVNREKRKKKTKKGL